MDELEKQIREIISQQVQDFSQLSVQADDDLFLLGLDSISAITILVELEELYQIKFQDEEMLFENFKSISSILRIVKGKVKVNQS